MPKQKQDVSLTNLVKGIITEANPLNYPVGSSIDERNFVFNNNGTSGSAALCMALKGNAEGAHFFSQLAATSYDGMETGHASTFFNPLWTPLGANLAGPEVTQQLWGGEL